ncbi:MAG: hypothetical protein FWF15_00665 [Oscillospiraceae bacterium]|nr:hypothetical protein [Oscillospiraceae bacterium]
MKTELHYYDIFPKVIPVGKESEITVKPLGWHAAFKNGAAYHLSVCPLEEGTPREFPNRRNLFEFDTKADTDGCMRFKFNFFAEQQYFIRIKDDDKFKIQLSVYAVDEDLCGRYPFKGDLHMHSRRSDGKEAPAIVCANYRKTGYDFFAITDHHRYYPSLEAIEAYKNVPIEFNIVPGEEVHFPEVRTHIVNFGGEYSLNGLIEESAQNTETGGNYNAMTKEQWSNLINEYAKTLDIPKDIEAFEFAACHWIFNEIRKANGLGIFCHPYWISNVFQIPPAFVDYIMQTQLFDAYEVLGGENYYEQNGFQTIQYYEDTAKGRNYPIIGSTDSHSSINNRNSHICSTIVFSPENERKSLIASIKDFYSVAVDTISAEPRFVGSLRLVKYACFLDQEFFPLHDDICYEEGRAMKDYVCGVSGAKEVLELISGRMKTQREKYFAF